MRACSAAQHRERTGMQLRVAQESRVTVVYSCQNGTYKYNSCFGSFGT